MAALFISIIVIVVLVFLYLDNNRARRAKEERMEQQPDTDTTHSAIYKDIKIEAPDGYEIMEVKIAGINYRRNMKDYVGQFSGNLVAEPNNEYDPEAIAIKCGRKKMGYIPENQTAQVREFVGGVLPYNCDGMITDDYDGNGRHYYYGLVVIARKKN